MKPERRFHQQQPGVAIRTDNPQRRDGKLNAI
jgi:hypothetical protein